MATESFGKSVVIEEPEAVNRLVDSLLNDEPRRVSENLLFDNRNPFYNPINMNVLKQSIADADAKKLTEHELLDV